jgi:hypothetical protein
VKAALVALVLGTIAPSHVRFAVLGIPVSVPVTWFLIAAEALAVAGTAYLTARAIRRFRSAPWPRFAFASGGDS